MDHSKCYLEQGALGNWFCPDHNVDVTNFEEGEE